MKKKRRRELVIEPILGRVLDALQSDRVACAREAFCRNHAVDLLDAYAQSDVGIYILDFEVEPLYEHERESVNFHH